MSYKRIPGGEKNSKSGVPWTKDELTEVYYLYKELNGEGLHERNPKIIDLARKLARTVRSVEAQSLMYRNLDRGGDYSHGNMNKLCREIWNENEGNEESERSDKKENNMKTTSEKPFPDKLKTWRSESIGGVRKPFANETGRPLGSERIKTNVLSKIEGLFVNGSVPKAILLVGGAGNGKTDTLEFIIEHLDRSYSCNDFILKKTYEAYKTGGRKKIVDLSDVKECPYDRLVLVQDASERELDQQTAEDSLISDIEDHRNSTDTTLYIACINRGKLDQARRNLRKTQEHGEVLQILQKVTNVIDPINALKGESCWPVTNLEGYYVWPMDVDSLFKKHDAEISVAEQIIGMATDLSKYQFNSNNNSNPLNDNVLNLSQSRVQSSLCELMHNIEIRNGFRLTFREVLSLTSYLILPRINETRILDCYEKIQNGTLFERLAARITLNKELFHNKLFFSFPSITTPPRLPGELEELQSVLSAMSEDLSDGGAVERNILSRDYSELDPIKLRSNTRITESYTIRDLNKIFSSSCTEGLSLVYEDLTQSEKELIKDLSIAENRLYKVLERSSKHASTIEEIIRFLKKYAGLIAKRGICIRGKVFNNAEIYDSYRRCISDQNELRKFIHHSFEKTLLDGDKLRVSFVANIGQDPATITEDAYMLVEPKKVSPNVVGNRESIPDWDLVSVKVADSEIIPISFELFESMSMVGKGGMAKSVVQYDVLTGMDSIKSKLLTNNIRKIEQIVRESNAIKLSKLGSIKADYDMNFEYIADGNY